MPFCEFCGEEIGYLPFKCKYCGGTYCKKHRLPENHDCSFELKHIPVVPTSSGESRKRYREVRITTPERSEYKYSGFPTTYLGKKKYSGTKFLLWMILIFSVVALISTFLGFFPYIYFSLQGLVYYYTYHTFFTALFVGSEGIFGLLLLFIILYFVYYMARYIELQFGTKFLINLYILCCLSSAMIYIWLRLLLNVYYPIETYGVYVGLAWGGILGILSFTLFPYYNRKITGLMYFIPMRVKGKTFLLIIILARVIPGLFYTFINPLNMLYYFPDLGGILAAYIVYYNKFRYR